MGARPEDRGQPGEAEFSLRHRGHRERRLRPPTGRETLVQPRLPVLVPADTHTRPRPDRGAETRKRNGPILMDWLTLVVIGACSHR